MSSKRNFLNSKRDDFLTKVTGDVSEVDAVPTIKWITYPQILRCDLSGISVLAAEMSNKSCYTLIEIYPGELCHQDATRHRQQLIG